MRLSLLLCLLPAALCVSAQEREGKSGCVVLPLPECSYSTDLGWQAGGITDICWYGNGDIYPDYLCKLILEASLYSKGNRSLHAFFDSKHQLDGIRASGAVSYFGNRTYPFYGYNGAAAGYDRTLDAILDDGTGFYLMSRNYFRALATIQGRFGDDSSLGWATGLTFYNVHTGRADSKRIAAGSESLYSIYCAHGVIPAGEEKGGRHLELKAGLSFDNRDHEDNPTRGISAELYAVASHDFVQGRNDYLRLVAHYKQFVPLMDGRLVLGWHLAWQGLVAGTAPCYMLQTLQTINLKQSDPEGLGSTMTFRGTVRNRLVGNSYGWSNLEFRCYFAGFRLLGQFIQLAANPFFDTGIVLRPYRLQAQKDAAAAEPAHASVIYSGNDEHLHCSAGAGLHIIINRNFNVNMELGRSFSRADGDYGLNLGMGYIF